VDLGNLVADNSMLAFTFSGIGGTRLWDIRVAQIECSNPGRSSN
jgi:hypothetical protein